MIHECMLADCCDSEGLRAIRKMYAIMTGTDVQGECDLDDYLPTTNSPSASENKLTPY